MTYESISRPMTDFERRRLGQIVDAASHSSHVWHIARTAVLSFVGSVVIAFVVWLSVAWPARLMGGLDVGLQSPFAPWVFGFGLPLCAIYAIAATASWTRRQRAVLRALRADLANGKVVEESHRFDGVRLFRDLERGDSMYFLRTAEGRVFTVRDFESGTVAPHAPPVNASQPRSELCLVRAPLSEIVIGKSFSGAELDAGAPLTMRLPSKDQPAPDTWCDIPWTELEQCLGGQSAEG